MGLLCLCVFRLSVPSGHVGTASPRALPFHSFSPFLFFSNACCCLSRVTPILKMPRTPVAPGPWRLARFTRPPTAAADVGRCRKMGRPPCARTRYIPRPLCVSLVKVSNSTPVCSRNQSSLGFRYYFLLVNLELSTITSLS